MAKTKSLIVSLWLGNFPSAEDLEKYVEIKSSKSEFLKDYKIRRIDPDFMESGWVGIADNIETLILDFSYSEYYMDMIKEEHPNLNVSDYNSTIMIIGEYEGGVTQTENTIFLGSYFFEYVNPY